MLQPETAEKPTLSDLAKQHPECAFRGKSPDKTFSLADGQPLFYWGSRSDLDAPIGDAVGFGLKPQTDNPTKKQVAQAKKAKVAFDSDCFFFLFNGENGETKIELLILVSKPSTKKLVFRRTGHTATF